MGQGQGGGPSRNGLCCPTCGAALQPPGRSSPDVAEIACPSCGHILRLRRREPRSGEAIAPRPPEPPTTGGLGLVLRGLALEAVEWAYHGGTFAGTGVLLALGGAFPVLGRWSRNELTGWGGVVEALGGVRLRSESSDPDADLGPVIARTDAPALFTTVEEVARRLGARPPGQIRLTYLPCCGVVAWGRSQALLLGLPLLDVLTRAELRAVLAHELAHLALGDATRAARSARFAEALGRALDSAPRRSISPLRLWAGTCRRLADRLLEPIARGQEARADRASASIAGGDAAASALVKVALVQPLFREVLGHYDPSNPDLPNLYAFFRAFWARLPDPLQTSIRHTLLSTREPAPDAAHPALLDRLAVVQTYPGPVLPESEHAPAAADLGDPEAMEQMLHNRLFATQGVEPSVFHRAGS